MAGESEIYDKDGKVIAVRHVEDYNGGKRVTTQEASRNILGIEHRGRYVDDRDDYPGGSEYEHKGRRLT